MFEIGHILETFHMEEEEKILRGALSQSELDLSCSIKCAASDISLSDGLLSPLHCGGFFSFSFLRRETVCMSPHYSNCVISWTMKMVVSNHICATLQTQKSVVIG